MSHSLVWLVEVAMNKPEAALAPLLLVLGVVVVWPRGSGKAKERTRGEP